MNIYISGLSYGMHDSDLKNLFTAYGEVSSAKIIMDRYTGKSRGFGFVEMPNTAEAEKAIAELNGTTHEGKTIAVNIAKEKTEASRNSGYNPNNNFRGQGNNSSRRY